MNVFLMKTIRGVGALALICSSVTAATAQTATSRIVSAANTFLSTLNEKQRQGMVFAFDDEKQRANWSNFPTSFVPRAGVSLKELNAAQRSAALVLVSSALSRRGFEKVEQIMEGDEVNKVKEGNNPIFGKDLYFISKSDKAFALLNALDENQRKQAILSYRLADLVLGPGQDGKTIQPEGLKASAMNDRQRAILLDLVSEWAGIIHESAAAARMAELKADITETWFAWSGPTTAASGTNITAYYRIQGPHLVIEYAPQRLGGDPSMHVHTMYRDPTNDYGRRLTAK